MRRLAAAAALGLAVTLVLADPASADPAKPTDYRSTVDRLEPASDAVRVDIVGGDAFLQVRVERGHEVVVEGYDGEPYLRVTDDGSVQENQRSEATFLNADRYAQVEVPADLDPADEPVWQTVDDDGEYTWHDHRVHWMSPERRPGIERGDVVLEWTVPMSVDGEPVAIEGTLVLEEAVSPLPWAAIGLGVLGASALFGWRRRSLLVAVVAAVVGAAGAVIAGAAEVSSIPAGAGGNSLVAIIPGIGAVAALLAALLLARRREAPAGIALLAAAAALSGWAFLRLDVLTKPVLPTDLSFDADRAATTVAIAAAIVAAVLTVKSGAIAPAPITDDEE